MGISVASYDKYDNMTPTERKDALINYIELEGKNITYNGEDIR